MFLHIDETSRREQASWLADFDELVDLEGDGSWCGRISGTLSIAFQLDRVVIAGRLTGLVPRECHRTLKLYLEPVATRVGELCEILPGAAAEARFDEEDEVWRVAPDGTVSLTEMVRQAVLLALPTHAVCEGTSPVGPAPDDKRGSEPQPVDPRLAVLQRLLEQEDETDGGSEEANE